jgi:hypothetical protein
MAGKSVSGGTWVVRAIVALLAGLAIGGASGVAGVTRLEPGHPGQADSLQLMLDSLKRMKDDDPREQRRAVDSADADRRATRYADSVALANDNTAPLVPLVTNLDEGAARSAIEAAGLAVGAVQFRAAIAPAGTVISSAPAGGVRVRGGTAISIVLSDGRPPTDTTDTLVAPPTRAHIP